MQLFVCADSRDEKQIQKLLTSVRRSGHRVWKSPFRTIASDKSWATTFEKIRNCDLFMFALTPQSLVSYRCCQQYAYAYNLKRNMLIVRLKDVGIITRPSALNEFTTIEYMARNSLRSKDLAKAIGELTCVLPLPTPLPPEPIVYNEGEPLLWKLSLSEIE